MRYPGPAPLAEGVAAGIAALAWSALRARGAFHIVLPGGRSPEAVFRLLAGLDTDWRRWHCWFGDERCVPRDDPRRNDLAARRLWLDRVPIPPGQVHPIPAERGPVAAARAYGQAVSAVDLFDLVWLGLGEDGHTASLFPGHPWGAGPDAPDALPVFGAPKPPPERVSLSARRLSRSRAVWFLAAGGGKEEALRRWRAGDAIPAAAITAREDLAVLYAL